ncbi:hypothetical protein [Pseudorhodoferax sp.]|uniref:hypothetical protein n=1 Tax=Pseudorhodoferax sp. TaxID=1993553 RepID=UPI0039E44528
MKLGNKLVGLVLLGAAAGSSAMTLGRARGNVVLGQPLSLAIEIGVNAADEASSQCFRAKVFHGDRAIDPGRVRVVVQPPDGGSGSAVLRLRSSAVVDEPVVGVVLQALCGTGGTRRYDFLPEFPADLVAAQAPAAVAPVPPVPAPSAAPAAPPVAARTAPAPVPAPPAAAVPRKAAPVAVRTAPAKAERQAPPRAVARAKAPAAESPAALGAAGIADAGGTPRLTLDAPLARQAGLQPSPALPGAPADPAAAAREEAAALWRAMQLTPEEIVREWKRMDALVAQAAARAAQSAQPGAAERELRARLEAAERRLDESERGRVDILLLYGLLALLLLAIGLAAYFWQRARNAALAAHWSVQPTAPSAPVPLETGRDAPFTFKPAAVARSSMADEFFDSEPASAMGAAKPSVQDGRAGSSTVFAQSARPIPAPAIVSRPVRPDEFFDVHQHAEFFISLGQYEQAVEVLEQHLREHDDMSPLGLLELLGLHHRLGRQDGYNAVRKRFEARFNAHLPSFAAFHDEGLGLEEYPATLLSIETAWGEARVLDTIEANLLRHPGDASRPLDLAAYRDLLLLYGVAQAIAMPAGQERTPSSFGGLGVGEPVAHAQPARPEPPPVPVPALPELDLELDLVPESGPTPLRHGTDHDTMASVPLDLDLSDFDDLSASAPSPLASVDIDLAQLDLDAVPASAPVAAPPPAKPELDSGMIAFDLFDPTTEAQIAPKSTRGSSL